MLRAQDGDLARRLHRFAAFEAAVGLRPRHARQRSDLAAAGGTEADAFGAFRAEPVSAQTSTASTRSDPEGGAGEALPLSSAAKARPAPLSGALVLTLATQCMNTHSAKMPRSHRCH